MAILNLDGDSLRGCSQDSRYGERQISLTRHIRPSAPTADVDQRSASRSSGIQRYPTSTAENTHHFPSLPRLSKQKLANSLN
jgi:hypothetical protein